jgi:hypothetical protein
MNQVRPPYAPPWFEFARFVTPDLTSCKKTVGARRRSP